ncbi:MAG: glycosyltransferase, partial [Candidatus Heimdallarchaeota archaeon]
YKINRMLSYGDTQMEKLWLLITSSIYFAIVLISLIYYMVVTIHKKERIDDSYLRSLEKEPLVSIVVPTYNEESNIERCLTSLRSLNYSNYEIILSDGGSTDKTIEIAEKFVDQIVVFSFKSSQR